MNKESENALTVITNTIAMMTAIVTLMERNDLKRARLVIKKAWGLFSSATENEVSKESRLTSQFVVDGFFQFDGDMRQALANVRKDIPPHILETIDRASKSMIEKCLQEILKLPCD